MRIRSWPISLLALIVPLCGAGPSVARAQAPPALFFTDLTSGPNTGNTDTTFSSSGNGAYVTIYGNYFGSSQGTSTITWNGQNCLTVIPAKGSYTGWGSAHLWYQEIIVQITSTCTPGTGNLVVTTSAGSSNGLSFTVRSLGTNAIYFVATNGSDSNAGTFSSAFGSIPHCAGSGDTSSVERAGDICYVEDGVNQTSVAGFGALTLNAYAGTSSLPIALVTYPGATSTIGSNSIAKGIEDCVGYIPQCNTAADQYLTIAGFHVRGVSYAVSIQGQNNRFVALEVQCPASANGENEGCFGSTVSYQTILGNEVSNTGMNLAPWGTCGKLCHNMYIGYPNSGIGTNFEIGWNSSHDANGGRLYQFYNGATAGTNINFHDNLGYNNVGVDGITMDANADAGYVNVYNNAIFNVCNTPDEGGDCSCLYLQDTAGTPAASVQVYNNTFGPGCSHNNSTSYGMYRPLVPANTVNNIFYATISGEPYLDTGCGTTCAKNLTGSNNVWYGGTGVPSQTANNITAQPLFVSITGCSSGLSGCSLAPASGTSPQVGVGVGSWTGGNAPGRDVNGIVRPNPPSVGAYEFSSAPPVKNPGPPGNLTVVVQ